MITAKTQRKYLFTPLRYPGGKTSLFEFFDNVIKENNLKNVTYVEPYAGGAGAALSLLMLENVEERATFVCVLSNNIKTIFI